MSQPVERIRHVPANWQGPPVPGYTYVYDKPPEQTAKEAADAQAKANAALATGGAGYSLDPGTIDGLINEIGDVIDWIGDEPRRYADRLVSIRPMGDEVGSQNYVQDANAAGHSYNNYLSSVIVELTRQRDTLKQARDAYQAQEQHGASALKGKTEHNA